MLFLEQTAGLSLGAFICAWMYSYTSPPMRKTLLNEMYAWCCGRPQCACHQFSQINTLMNGPRTGTGVALLASQQPASTIEDSAYWQWGVLVWTKGEPNEIWACVYDKWERHNTGLVSGGTWVGFCSIVTLPWRDRARVWRLLAANRVRLELYWNLQSSVAMNDPSSLIVFLPHRVT